MSDAPEDNYVEHVSAADFAATMDRLCKAIEAAGMTVLARIDHAAGARQVGATLPPATVILYGHPRGGTPIMAAALEAGLDLPLRVLVREPEPGRVVISYHPIASLLRRRGVPEDLAVRLEPAQKLLVEAIR